MASHPIFLSIYENRNTKSLKSQLYKPIARHLMGIDIFYHSIARPTWAKLKST